MAIDVSYYPGCTEHSTGMEYTLSTRAVLKTLGVNLIELPEWNCCGGAAAHSVSHMLGLALPARNIAKAQDMDMPLAIPCPGCFNAVKRAEHAMETDDDMRRSLEDIIQFKYKGKLDVKAIHNIILDIVGIDKVKTHVKKPLNGLRVVSYYGCALVREPDIVKQGDHENPMFLDDLVTALGGFAQDWSYKVDCCGADLGMSHGKIATDIADKLAAAAEEADADCIMTCCGLCQVNLDIRQSGKKARKVPVMYLTELMGITMDLPDREFWWDKHIVSPRQILQDRHLL